MTTSVIPPDVIHYIRQQLEETSWPVESRALAPQACFHAFRTALSGALATESPTVAMSMAWNSASAATSDMVQTDRDCCLSVAASWTVHTLMHAALARSTQLPSELRGQLYVVATGCARAVGPLTLVTPSRTATKQRPPDHAVSLARNALVYTLPPGSHPFDETTVVVQALFRQMRPSIAVLAVGESSVPEVVTTAVTRARQWLREQNNQTWIGSSVDVQSRMVGLAIAQAAHALARAAYREPGHGPVASEVRRWLCSLAGEIMACVPEPGSTTVPQPESTGRETSTATPVVMPADTTVTRREGSMSDTAKSILKTLEVDATEAAWRTAGSQFVKLTREPLVGMLCRHIAPDDASLRARLAAFLETEVGTAMLSAFLSLALGAMPPAVGEVPARLSRELRVRAMADVGDVLAELLMGPLRQVMTTYLAGVQVPVEPRNLPLNPPAAVSNDPATVGSVVAGVPTHRSE